MPRSWTEEELLNHRKTLAELYVKQNKSIGEIADELGIAYQTVFDRLKRVQIPTQPELKSGYLHKRKDIQLPKPHDARTAEFLGIMFGDGHISSTQVTVTLGDKELEYVRYVRLLLSSLFNVPAQVHVRPHGYRVVYFGSVDAVRWCTEQGLAHNKVASQVSPPSWIYEQPEYLSSFLRGFFDTDGSVYALRFGVQASFTNRSTPLLRALRRALVELGYKPSVVSGYAVYLTRREDVERFFNEIRPANTKHRRRYRTIRQDLTRR